MPRGQHQIQIPKKIYFVDTVDNFLGPYTKKPTTTQNMFGGVIITFELDDNGNYIKK